MDENRTIQKIADDYSAEIVALQVERESDIGFERNIEITLKIFELAQRAFKEINRKLGI